MAIGTGWDFSMLCSNGHASYERVNLLHADDPFPLDWRCPKEHCISSRWEVDRCRAGERPLKKGRLV